MSDNNYGKQSGNNSVNVGVGDFRGAEISISENGKPIFTPEQLQIVRNPILGSFSVKRQSLNIFGTIGSIASIAGLYFTLFQAHPSPQKNSWIILLFLISVIAIFCLNISTILKIKRFQNFSSGKYYLQLGTKDGIYLNSFSATCPWCGSSMDLRNNGQKNGPRNDLFICERNSKQHRVLLDPTVLSEIVE